MDGDLHRLIPLFPLPDQPHAVVMSSLLFLPFSLNEFLGLSWFALPILASHHL